MTPAQLVILGAYLQAQPDLASQPFTPAGTTEIQRLLGLPASPVTTAVVWRTSVPLGAVVRAFDPNEFEALNGPNRERLQLLAGFLAEGVDPSSPNVREFFLEVFSGAGGATTRAALLVLWATIASRVERLYATGTGSPASPATLTYTGAVSYEDVDTARRLP